MSISSQNLNAIKLSVWFRSTVHRWLARHNLVSRFSAPPTADAASSSADLYYEIDNREMNLMPGQRVGVDIPMTSVTEAFVVPAAAILYDIYGGTWVYVQSTTSDKEPSSRAAECCLNGSRRFGDHLKGTSQLVP